MALDEPVILDVSYKTGQDKVTNKFFLEAEVVLNSVIPAHVFLYRRDLEGTDDFCTIASVVDLGCWPVDAPCDGSPFFLKDSIKLEFDCAKDLQTVLDEFRSRLGKLVSDYKILVCELGSEFVETYNSDVECP